MYFPYYSEFTKRQSFTLVLHNSCYFGGDKFSNALYNAISWKKTVRVANDLPWARIPFEKDIHTVGTSRKTQDAMDRQMILSEPNLQEHDVAEQKWAAPFLTPSTASMTSFPTPEVRRFPEKLTREQFYPTAYLFMRLARRMEDKIFDLYRQGLVKGTVTQGIGNEAAAIGAAFPFRPGLDVISLLHRDLGSHLLLGSTPYQLFCQYLANADSPTLAREGNVHHGDAARRRFPMISHLGGMLSTVVGAVWSAQKRGENACGLAVIGDGGSSTGSFHEALNLASVFHLPVLFLVENNSYAFSTPTEHQYRCARLSDRAAGYGMPGETIDGTDVWAVYDAVTRQLTRMHAEPSRHSETICGGPAILEVRTHRLVGHAVYDAAKYIDPAKLAAWHRDDPLLKARIALQEVVGFNESQIATLENDVESEISEALEQALAIGRPVIANRHEHSPAVSTDRIESAEPAESNPWAERTATICRAPAVPVARRAYRVERSKMGEAVTRALDYLLESDPNACLLGLDIGEYGSAFKTCKGLFAKYPMQVIDMPICEAGITGFALGASQTGTKPIVEYQFADFATEATTQIGLNAATWYWRSGSPAPMLLRMPCGGGVTMGPFHSAEYEGLWSRFPGILVLYPTTPQEMFEAIIAGYDDPNPVCVMEHKLLYWSMSGAIHFAGNLDETTDYNQLVCPLSETLLRPRCHRSGRHLTVVAIGAMLRDAAAAIDAWVTESTLKTAMDAESAAKRVEVKSSVPSEGAKNPMEISTAVATEAVELWNPFVLEPSYWGPIVESVRKTGRLLVIQESGSFAGVADALIRKVTEEAFDALKAPPRVLASRDEPVPFAPELELQYRPSVAKILSAIHSFF